MLVFRCVFPNSKETANHDCHFHDPVAFQWLINSVSSSIHLSLYPFYRLLSSVVPLLRCPFVPVALFPSIPLIPQKRGSSSIDLAPHLVQKMYKMYNPCIPDSKSFSHSHLRCQYVLLWRLFNLPATASAICRTVGTVVRSPFSGTRVTSNHLSTHALKIREMSRFGGYITHVDDGFCNET